MKQGLETLAALSQKVMANAERKDDLVVPAHRLIMLNGSELSIPVLAGAQPTEGRDPEMGTPRIEYGVSEIAHRQIGTHLGIPAKFYDRLRTATIGDDGNVDTDLRQLLDRNVNTLLQRTPQPRMIRTYKPTEGDSGLVRAFLSNRYHRRDDEQLLVEIAKLLGDLPGAMVASCDVTETRFYLKIVTERLEGEVKKGDFVQAGVCIANSEVGHGSLSIKPFLYRLVCLNGMVAKVATDEMSVYRHVGGRIEADETGRYSAATVQKDDEAFYAKVREDVKRAVDETAFNSILVQLREATETKAIDDPSASIERLSQRFSLTQGEGKDVLKHLALGGDLTAYGALNAITRTAQDVDSYDRATELEAIGGMVLDLATSKPREWEAIAA